MLEKEPNLSQKDSKLGIKGYIPGEPLDFNSAEAADLLRKSGVEASRSLQSYELTSKNGKRAVVNIFMKAGQEGISVEAYLGAQGQVNNFGMPESYERKMVFEPMPPKMPEGKKIEDLTSEEKQKMGTEVLENILASVIEELEKQ